MFLSRERRRTLALYMLARIAQCLYNSLKQQGRFHLWGSDWAYGDALLFALSSAQVLIPLYIALHSARSSTVTLVTLQYTW